MSTIEQRLQVVEDHLALERVFQSYYAAVDTMSDLDGIVACFTEDGVFDVTPLGLKAFQGQQEIRDFFKGAFADTKWHVHHVTNFRVTSLEGDRATGRGYVFARAEGKTGMQITVHCYIDVQYVRTAAGWKIKHFYEGPLVPLGDAVSELHQSA